MSYAQPKDVVARLGRALEPTETDYLQALLDDVELSITERISDLTARVTANTIPTATLVKIEAWTVIRFLKNPDAKLQESIDDYAFTRAASVSSGMLELTEEDWATLLPAEDTAGAFSISLIAGRDTRSPVQRWLE